MIWRSRNTTKYNFLIFHGQTWFSVCFKETRTIFQSVLNIPCVSLIIPLFNRPHTAAIRNPGATKSTMFMVMISLQILTQCNLKATHNHNKCDVDIVFARIILTGMIDTTFEVITMHLKRHSHNNFGCCDFGLYVLWALPVVTWKLLWLGTCCEMTFCRRVSCGQCCCFTNKTPGVY